MQKISDSTNTASAAGEFTEGSSEAGVDATLIKAQWLNAIQRELVAVVLGSGMSLDAEDDGQVLKAIGRLLAPAFDFNNLTNKPTTLGGYGIDDAWRKGEVYSKNESYSRYDLYTRVEIDNLLGGVVRGDYCGWVGFSLDNKDIPYMRHKASGEAVYLALRAATLDGYGIVNAYTDDQINSLLAVRDTNFVALAQEVGRRVVNGGGGLNDNLVRIGYLHAAGAVRVHVDDLDFGNIWTDRASELSLERVKLPNGFTLMTGLFSLGASAGASQSIYFPIAFTAFFMGGWVQVASGGAIDQIYVSNEGLKGMIIGKGNNDTFARVGRWFAIGK